MRALQLVLFAVLVLPGAARAAEPMPSIVANVADDFLLPRYEMFAAATERLAGSVAATCAAPDAAGTEAVRGDYSRAADLWSRVEFVRMGPLEADSRYEKIFFWPERRNATVKGLAALKAEAAAGPVTIASDASAAVQGLPAVERLVFDDETFKAGDPGHGCAVAVAVSRRLAELAGEVARDWPAFLAPMRADAGTAREGVSRLVTDTLAQYHVIIDTKLRRPLGRGTDDGLRPELFEGIRAGRTIRALQMNLGGLDEVLRLLVGETAPTARQILNELADVRLVLDDVPDLTEDNDGADKRLRDDRFIASLRRVQKTSYDEVPILLGIVLGFNALDGD